MAFKADVNSTWIMMQKAKEDKYVLDKRDYWYFLADGLHSEETLRKLFGYDLRKFDSSDYGVIRIMLLTKGTEKAYSWKKGAMAIKKAKESFEEAFAREMFKLQTQNVMYGFYITFIPVHEHSFMQKEATTWAWTVVD